MAKVVTSEGLSTFVQTGTPTEVIVDKRQGTPKSAPALQMDAQIAAADAPEAKTAETASETAAETPKNDDLGLEPEDHDLAERAKKRIGKKHYQMKLAEESAAEAERFAETQFNERQLWQKRAEEAERKAAELTPKEKAPPELMKPDPNTYVDDKGQFKSFEYAEALAEYSAKKAVADDRKIQAEQAAAAQAEAQKAQFKARIDAAVKKNPDWDEVVRASPTVLPFAALQYIQESEYGTDIAYFLAKNPEVAERIKNLHPIRAVAELGKIETSFEKPANAVAGKTVATDSTATSRTVEPKGAPPPITPISTSGSGSVNIDPAKMSYKELRAYERERNRKR